MKYTQFNWDRGSKQAKRDKETMDKYHMKEGRICKEVYDMFGEYLANLRKPYPRELILNYRPNNTDKKKDKE